MKTFWGHCAKIGVLVLVAARASAVEDTSIAISVTNNAKVLQLPLVSGVDQFKVLRSPSVTSPFTETTSGTIAGYEWTEPGLLGSEFFTVDTVPKSSNDVLTATVLNRLAYGPTPDELERVTSIGPEAYIQEQLAPENISEQLPVDVIVPDDQWQYVTVTGPATSSILYIYSTGVGDFYLDSMKLVAGSVAEAGANLLNNGDFENGLTGWNVSANLADSAVVTDVVHDGLGALHLISAAAGSTKTNSIWRDDLKLTANQTYTLSYWYKGGASNSTGTAVLRVSGASETDTGITGIYSTGNLASRLAAGNGSLSKLCAWHLLHAVQSKKQLLEVLLQFCENHFVTQESKSRDYMGRYYDNPEDDAHASNLEYREVNRWRQALLNPQCTFYDLLKISAESPAMIIYLDTVDSRGNGKNVANENYARELLELFTFGVDNGYDQNDITVESTAWTGWTLRLMAKGNELNPFATNSFVLRLGGTNQPAGKPPTPVNAIGTWGFYYDATRHNTNSKTIFPGKTVPARFGAPYANRNYELVLPARNGTNSIQDGYTVLAHVADQPFTQEFISVKLCRLFVHDDFVHGTYDYTDPNLSPEGQLVRDCMRAWEGSEPKGQIRKVLDVIFHSALFRGQDGSMQKVKTPLEYTVSAVRAFRSVATDGTSTADTDGYSLRAPMSRMGNMRLFDRDTPDGFPEVAAPWISAGTLTERLRFVQALMYPVGTGRPTDAGRTVSDPVKLLKVKLPQSSWKDASAVASYFLRTLFPGEGKANLDQYRAQAMSYLNTADDGVASSPFTALVDTSSTYDLRVRGMVAMLMTFQRFQEQ
jgi:uncharacterized protein (DUF1800 family)